MGYFWKAKRSVFARQMSWRPQYRSSKFRNVYGKVASREHCFDGIPITKNVHDNHFCAVNARFLAIVTESAGGGSFLVIPLEQVRGLAPAEVTPIWSRSLSAGVWTHAPSRECPSCSGMRRSLRSPFLGFSCAGKGGFTGAVANWGFFFRKKMKHLLKASLCSGVFGISQSARAGQGGRWAHLHPAPRQRQRPLGFVTQKFPESPCGAPPPAEQVAVLILSLTLSV